MRCSCGYSSRKSSRPLPPILPPGGISFSFQNPCVLAGLSAMFQAGVSDTMAMNGILAMTDGHEVKF